MFNTKEFKKGLRGFDVNRARMNFWHSVSEFADTREKEIQKKQADKVLKAMQKSGMSEAEQLMLVAMIYAAGVRA